MIDIQHFTQHIIRPTLEQLPLTGAYKASAVALLGFTAMAESKLTYLVQHGDGPALGLYQIEPATHHDLWENWLPQHKYYDLRQYIRHTYGDPRDDKLVYNLAYATVIARLVYYRIPEAIPHEDDLYLLAAYWKKYYNTGKGKGTISHFVNAAKRARYM